MTLTIDIGYISENNELTLLWSNNDIQPRGFPKHDGKFSVQLVDDKLQKLTSFLGKLEFNKIGKKIKIYLGSPYGTKAVYKEFSDKNDVLTEVAIKKPTVNQSILKFLLEKCPDLQQVLDISNFSRELVDNVVEVENARMNSKNRRGRERSAVRRVQQQEDVIFRRMERFMGRNFPVKGNIQSGKTKFMLSLAIWFMLNQKSTLIVLRNFTDDSEQIQSRITYLSNQLKNELERCGLDRNMFGVEFVNKNKINKEVIRGEKPKIMIALYNKSQLQNFHDLLTDDEKNKYVVCIDEADMIHKTVTGEEKTEKDDVPASVYLDRIVKNCFCSFSVSGTILDAILKDNIKAEDLIVLKSPPGYKSHNSFLVSHLELPCKFTTSTTGSIIENDPNIIPHLHAFSNLGVFSTFYNNEKHPNYLLLRVADVIKPMEDLFNTVINDFQKIAFMLYNGGGVKFHHGNLCGVNSIKLSNNAVSRNENGVHIFGKGANPSLVLEWLKKNGGVDKYPHIVTIAGDLASRGISFGSADFADCINNNKLGWHLTGMYATFAKNTDLAELLQIVGRLCIVSFDGMPLTLYITENDHLNMIKGFNITEEFVNRAKAQSAGTLLNDFLKSTPMYRKKVPVGRRLTKHESFKVKKTTEKEDVNSGGWMTDKAGNYVLTKVLVKTGDITNEDVSPVTKEGIVFGEEKVEEAEIIDISVDETVDAKYYFINSDILADNSIQKHTVSKIIKVITEKGLVNKNIFRTDVIKHLLELNDSKLSSIYQICGNFDKGIIPKMKKINNINVNGLVYWKESGRKMFRLNINS